jgi:MFS family permease
VSSISHEVGGLKAWRVCLSAGLFFFYEFIQLNVFDVLNPILRSQLLLQAASLSLLSSAFLWANLLFLIPAGLWLDHYSVKRVILGSLFVCVLGTVIIAVSSQFEVIFMGRFLTGIGNAFCFLSCVILVSRWFAHAQQGLVMGLMVTLAFVGGMLAHTPFAYLVQAIGWRSAMWIDVGFGLLIFCWICLNVKDAPKGWIKEVNLIKRRWHATFMTVLRQPQTYFAGLYTSLLNLPILVLCALWGASYLEKVHGVHPLQATGIVSCLFLGSMLGCPLLGWMSDYQRKRKPMMWFGVLGAILSFIPLYLGHVQPVWVLSLVFFALGFFTSSQVLSYPLLAESHLPQQVGAATGVASLIIMGGGAIGQMLFGGLMQYGAGTQAVNYSAVHFQFAMNMFPVAFGLAALSLIMIRETYCRRLGLGPT